MQMANVKFAPKQQSPLLPQMQEWANDGGMPEDDPLRKMLLGMAAQQDRIEGIVKSFGPDAGKLAADAARRETAIGMRSLRQQVGWLGKGLLVAGGAFLFGVGLLTGQHQAVHTEIGPMPREMANATRLQDWPAQWASCMSNLKRQEGVDWCVMPFVVNVRRVGI